MTPLQTKLTQSIRFGLAELAVMNHMLQRLHKTTSNLHYKDEKL